jgi:DNA-binding transcriptional LysR family regulator
MDGNLAGMMLDERQLRFVLALAEELHFGNAALRLHVSQSGLSGAIKKLERALGVQIFRRTSRHVALTDAGRVFVEQARHVVAHAEHAVARVRGQAAGFSGPFRVGYSPSIDLAWLCSLISRARTDADFPFTIEFVSADAIELQIALTKGGVQAVMIAGRLLNRDLESTRLFRERFTIAMRSRHPLAGRRNTLTPGLLEREPAVWLRSDLNPQLHEAFLKACASQGFRPNIAQEVQTFAECLQFARQGLGITFLPQYMQRANLRRLVFGRLREPLSVEFSLAFRRDDRTKALRRFTAFVQRDIAENRPSDHSRR